MPNLPCHNILMDWDPINPFNSAPFALTSMLSLEKTKRALFASMLGVENIGQTTYIPRSAMPPHVVASIFSQPKLNHRVEQVVACLEAMHDPGDTTVESGKLYRTPFGAQSF